MAADINTPCAAYNDMAAHWNLIRDLMGGTLAMRKARTTWLPKEAEEHDLKYNARLDRSILYNGLRDTVKRLKGKPFSKPVSLSEDLPERLMPMQWNIDGEGRSLSDFAGDLFYEMLQPGIGHVFVDYPRVTDANPSIERSLYPHLIYIPAEDMIWWNYEIENGKKVLSEIRFRQTKTVPDGMYGEKSVDQVRRYTRSEWQVFEYSASAGDFIETDSGPHTFGAMRDSANNLVSNEDGETPGQAIPLVTFYANRTGYMTADPPLEDLAWLNLAHWQSFSDQRNILKVARLPILAGKGLSKEDVEKKTVIGPNMTLKSSSPDAQWSFVEHSGKAIEAGRQDLVDLEFRMEVLGLQPLMTRRSGQQTATGQRIDESRTESDIQSWITSIEGGLETCFEHAATWTGVELHPDFAVDIFQDFGIGYQASEEIKALIMAREKRQISHETFLREIRRRGLLSETVDIAAEIQAVADEQPPLGTIGDGGMDDGGEEPATEGQ